MPQEPVSSGFDIRYGNKEDGKFITGKPEEYNTGFVPRTHPYPDLSKKAVNAEGIMIAGCIAGVSGWDTVYVDALWVDGSYRGRRIGSFLLDRIEREAKEAGAYLTRADAPEFGAGFLLKRGYTVSVVYEDDPKMYIMQKAL